MVGCFYASQIVPLNSRERYKDRDEFMWVMDDRKDSEWLDIKELTPLQYMPYVTRCFQETTGHHLKGLSKHTGWIRAKGYYHWKVADLNQLEHCPHLRGLPVPPGPMTCPSELQSLRSPIDPGPPPLVPLGIIGPKDHPPQGKRPTKERGPILILRHLVILSHWGLGRIGRRQ